MKPTITIMARQYWPSRFGGLEHVLWELSNALVDQGTNLTVLTERNDGQPKTQHPRPGLRIGRLTPADPSRLWRVNELIQVRWWMKALRHAPAEGWLWANEPTAAAAAILTGRADRLLYRPVFCYDAMHRVAKTHPEMRGYARTPLSRWLDRRCYRRAAVVVDESNNLREQHRECYGYRPDVHVLRNPTAKPQATAQVCTRANFDLDDGHFVVGFVGRPGDPCKDLLFLLSALQAKPLPKHGRLLIVGGGDGLDDAKRWVREAGLDGVTLFTGAMDDPAAAYRAMDTLVLPSRFETFGNVIVEAMSHGVPVLARQRDALAKAPIYTASDELISDRQTGFVVDPHDPRDLADALHYLADHPVEARVMRIRAAVDATRKTWQDAAAQYLELLGYGAAVYAPPRRQYRRYRKTAA